MRSASPSENHVISNQGVNMSFRNIRPLNALSALCLAMALAPASHAGTVSGNFQVQATVVSACLVSATMLNFGNSIDPTVASVPVDATTTMTVICTSTTPYNIALNAGVNAGGASNFATRTIKTGAHTLGYQLYLDAGHATVWGDGTATTSQLAGTGIGSNQTLTIYGRMPSLTGAVPGTYTDTVTVTVTY
jgi:spore coat protein U-like protein